MPDPIVKVVTLSTDELEALLERAVEKALRVANGNASSEPKDTERLLTPDEAAALLNVHRRWMYRHAKNLPFTRRLSRKALRFSEPGLLRWQASRKS